ncbi:MAG TPA: ATPase [Opitutae bacterium]|nr:ATPase [Opitutae bacterium]
MIERLLAQEVKKALARQAVVGILGPRQVGKTTLARHLSLNTEVVHLDLESPQDLAKLNDPMQYLARQQGKLVVLDEIQRAPELFAVLRVLVDKNRREGHRQGQFLILGSSSVDLLKQSSESLAGRITYLELNGLTALEINDDSLYSLWLRGGFPDSYLATNDAESDRWRADFIKTYLERDIPQWGPQVPAETLRRLWTMLGHLQGSIPNLSMLAGSIDVSVPTVKRYIDLLTDLFLVRRLMPWHSNTKKRLIKSPKVYIRDSGLLHHLLGIPSYDALLSHPQLGNSWEGFVIENICAVLPYDCAPYFYRTAGGSEIDLLLKFPEELWAVEIKKTSAPKVKRGFYEACEDLQPTRQFVIYDGTENFPLNEHLQAMGLTAFLKDLCKMP